MIYLGSFLIVSAGATATLIKRSTIQDLCKPRSKRLIDMLILSTYPSAPRELLNSSTPSMANRRETKETRPINKKDRARTKPEPSYSTYRLIASTGAVALATTTFFVSGLVPISLFITGALAGPIFAEAYTSIVRDRKLKVDLLDAAVILLGLLFGKLVTAACLIWILDLANLLLEQTTRKSREYVTEVFGQQPRYAWKLVDGQEVRVPVMQLKKKDQIVIRIGEQVPVDGVVVEGEAMLDQQSLTGEAAPAEKHKGDQIFAMTAVVSGKIYVEVTETGENTLASRIVQIISDTANHKVKLQSIGEQRADQMVLPTFGLGALGYMYSGTSALLAIINADYGTGIRVAAPIALLASLGNAAKNGILIKDSKILEILPDIDVVIFDKTGTLTDDVPIVSQIVIATDAIDADKILFYTAVAEQKFTHPIARAIAHKAEEKNMSLPTLDELHYQVGFGIEVSLNGSVIKVGSSQYMERERLPLPQVIQDALHLSRSQGNSAILTAVNDQVIGMIEMQMTPREEAIHVIEFLKARGISEIVLISGDHEAPTQELTRQLGIEQFVAGVLPHEKAQHVQIYQEAGKKVMMVGDGINDSAALSLADVSVSLKGASTIATDVADVIFMDDSLKRFEYLYTVSDMLNRNIQRSFLMIVIPNTVCIAGAFVGILGLSSALILSNGFNFIAAFNGMLPLLNKDDTTQDHLLEDEAVAKIVGEAQA